MPEIVVIWEYKSKQVSCGSCHTFQIKRQKKKKKEWQTMISVGGQKRVVLM